MAFCGDIGSIGTNHCGVYLNTGHENTAIHGKGMRREISAAIKCFLWRSRTGLGGQSKDVLWGKIERALCKSMLRGDFRLDVVCVKSIV